MRSFNLQGLWRNRYGVMAVMALLTLYCWVQILDTWHHDNGLAFGTLSSHTDTQPVLMAVDATFVAKKTDPLLTHGMVLLGVVSRLGQPALALLQLGPGQQAHWYQEGQAVWTGLRLDKVWSQAVTLSAHGQLSTLMLAHRSQ